MNAYQDPSYLTSLPRTFQVKCQMKQEKLCFYNGCFFLNSSKPEPAISYDLITKHYISSNTFLFYLLCLRLCFKYNIYFLLKHHFLP